jgi:hypothetical protein
MSKELDLRAKPGSTVWGGWWGWVLSDWLVEMTS